MPQCEFSIPWCIAELLEPLIGKSASAILSRDGEPTETVIEVHNDWCEEMSAWMFSADAGCCVAAIHIAGKWQVVMVERDPPDEPETLFGLPVVYDAEPSPWEEASKELASKGVYFDNLDRYRRPPIVQNVPTGPPGT